ncbi:hypothetical protein [Arcobacter venerupis]|uniref:hypothetical protein n=1 Tax=Arcobacter venerupis TaxID=1054033 RepID=UPI000FEBABBE|nr:hypothetical protein [Arcobacter venerupis]
MDIIKTIQTFFTKKGTYLEENNQKKWRYLSFISILIIAVFIFFTYEIKDPSIEVEKELKQVATKEYLEKKIIESLNENKIEDSIIYRDMAEYLNIDLSEELSKKLEEKNTFFSKVKSNTHDFGESFVTGESDSMAGLAGSTISDMLIVGDIRDLSLEGQKLVSGEEYDSLVMGLAAIGVGMSASQLVTLGGSSSLKISTSIMKFAKKTNNLTKKFTKNFSSLLSKSMDYSKLKSIDFKDTKNLKTNFASFGKTIDLKHTKELFENISILSKNVSSKIDTIKLLKYVDNTDDLKRLNKISAKFGSKTKGVFKILGKNALTIGEFIINFTLGLIIQLFSLIISLVVFVASFKSKLMIFNFVKNRV